MSRHFLALALAALCLVAAGCKTQLYGSLQEKEANAVLAALLGASIPAEKRPGAEGTYTIFVEETEFARAMNLLDSLALPGKHYDDLGTVFGKVAMFSTPMEEKARYLYALQEELAQTVAKIEGVLAARVHLVLAEQDQMGRELQKPSAAVFVKHVDDPRLDPAAYQRDIRRLVAASVPNLEEERIVVSFFPAPPRDDAAYAVQPMRTILGFRVAEESVNRVWLTFGAAAALCLGLVGLTAVLFLRRKKK